MNHKWQYQAGYYRERSKRMEPDGIEEYKWSAIDTIVCMCIATLAIVLILAFYSIGGK